MKEKQPPGPDPAPLPEAPLSDAVERELSALNAAKHRPAAPSSPTAPAPDEPIPPHEAAP